MDILIKIPDEFNYSEHDIRMIIGVSFYEKRIMGSNECAEAVNIEYGEFIREMGKYGESVFESGVDELSDEFKDFIYGTQNIKT